MNSQQQFPLPASMPPSSVAAVAASMRNAGGEGKDPEDLRIPTSSPFLSRGALPGAHPMPGHPGMGSALLDTYLSMIAAAGGDSASMAAALGSFPGRAAAFAAQAAAASQLNAAGGGPELKANGKEMEERSISEDREDEAMPSDADISDNEEDKDDEVKNEAGLAAAVEAAQAVAAATAAAGEDN